MLLAKIYLNIEIPFLLTMRRKMELILSLNVA